MDVQKSIDLASVAYTCLLPRCVACVELEKTCFVFTMYAMLLKLAYARGRLLPCLSWESGDYSAPLFTHVVCIFLGSPYCSSPAGNRWV